MPKLTKKSIEELSRILNVIPKEELDMYWGMYDNDCFWRCVAWLKNGDRSEAAAASYAEAYWTNEFGGTTEACAAAISHLAMNGGGMYDYAAISYVEANSLRNSIFFLNPDILGDYMGGVSSMGGAWHSVVRQSSTSTTTTFYDPQNDKTFTIDNDLLNGSACKPIWQLYGE